MKAILCKELGDPSVLVLEEVDAPKPKPGEVRIAVRAVGVNFPDVLITAGKYQFRPDLPFSPGMECAGDVLELGADVNGVKVGDRVIAMPGWGGYREELTIDAGKLIPMPASMSFEHAAAFPVTYGTTIHALKQRAELQPGEVLCVHGAGGGVGLAAVEIGKVVGARVIATAGSDDKLAIAKEHGADVLINYGRERIRDAVKAATDGKGADVIYDPVGGDAMDESIRCVNWNGRILVIGFASGRIAEIPANLVLLKSCSLVGVFWGAFTTREPEVNAENFRMLMRWYEEGRLRPHVSLTVPLERTVEALEALIARKVIGKAVVTVGG